ncbi:class I SAM-dependent methyltransferase family protein [Candidatus Micrarchaeota archaeon]|nr:class I SAM-dependent methyltransferase family protein [Candidatus Micrarchaeota archaeon]
MLFMKVPRKKAEEARRKIVSGGIYAEGYKAFHDEQHVYFPVLHAVEGYGTIEMEGEKFERVKGLRELLAGILTDEELENLVTSYDLVGDIAIIEIPDELESKQKQIADAVLKTNKRLKVVAKKLGRVDSEFRVRPLKAIAGENRTETTYVEHGCRMRLDVAKVYFSIRLSNERKRIAELVKPGEHILALFAGVGPFPLVIAKKQPNTNIVAIELNPEGVRYMRENVRLNKNKNITVESGDAREIVFGKYRGFADRILMPLPRSAETFLDVAFAGARDGCMVHIYNFAPIENPYADIEKRIAEEAKKAGAKAEIVNRKIVRPYAPKIVQVVVDFRIKKA